MPDKQKTIIAFGDGGLDSKCAYIDLYILAQAKKKKPKVCFLPTAGADNQGLIKYFYSLYERYPCEASHLSLFNPHTADIKDFILSRDVIFVGGGQSKTMMAIWKGWQVDLFLKEAYENGTVLAGGSAGSVCWFDQCITDSIPGRLSVMDCLGFLHYSNCPHYASYSRRAAYAKHIMSGEIKLGYAADDYAGIHFVNGEFFRAVSGRPYAKVYKCEKIGDRYAQKRLKTKWLGMKEYQQEFIFNSPMFGKDIEINSNDANKTAA
jgi:dipeptidase E